MLAMSTFVERLRRHALGARGRRFKSGYPDFAASDQRKLWSGALCVVMSGLHLHVPGR